MPRIYAVFDAGRDDLPECDICENRASVVRLQPPDDDNPNRWYATTRCLIHADLDKWDRKRIKRMIEARKGNR